MRSPLLLVEPDPSDPTLWRYGRTEHSGELLTYGLLRYLDGAIEPVDDPGWPTSHDAVTAMCLIRVAKGERRAITYDLSWTPVPPVPPPSRPPVASRPVEHQPTLGERAEAQRRGASRSSP